VKLRKPVQNLLVDVAALIAFVMMLGTGFMLRYVLPPGSGGAEGAHGGAREYLTVWGLSRHEWGSVHYGVSLALLAILALHLLLHWQWIVAMVRGKPREASGLRVAVGVVGLVGVILLAAAPLLSPVERQARVSERPQPAARSITGTESAPLADPAPAASADTTAPVVSGAPRPRHASHAVQGRMTLTEVADECGLDLPRLLAGLSLPADTPGSERVGRLQARGALTIRDVRRLCDR
jgi:hypothetical protein